jgi:hypothetical protein
MQMTPGVYTSAPISVDGPASADEGRVGRMEGTSMAVGGSVSTKPWMLWIAGNVTQSADGETFDVLYANDGATEFSVPSHRVKQVGSSYVIQRLSSTLGRGSPRAPAPPRAPPRQRHPREVLV